LLKIGAVKGILHVHVSKKIFPYFLNFSSIWIRFTTGDIHKNLCDCEFPGNPQWKQNFTNMCQWIHICTFQLYCPMWVKCSIRNVNIIVLSICEFHKNQHTDGHAFLMGVHKITFTFMSTAISATPTNPHHSTYIPQMADAWQQFIYNVTTVQ